MADLSDWIDHPCTCETAALSGDGTHAHKCGAALVDLRRVGDEIECTVCGERIAADIFIPKLGRALISTDIDLAIISATKRLI